MGRAIAPSRHRAIAPSRHRVMGCGWRLCSDRVNDRASCGRRLSLMVAEAPKNLGKYEVLHEVGRGSMGTVYLGHDPYIDRPVAIKVAHAEQLNDEEGGDRYRKMFFNEAHTAGRLTHPNIIGIYDGGVDGDACYIVMELVEGGNTLKDYCRPDNLLPLPESRRNNL
jgi:serine/threonine protein kinase